MVVGSSPDDGVQRAGPAVLGGGRVRGAVRVQQRLRGLRHAGPAAAPHRRPAAQVHLLHGEGRPASADAYITTHNCNIGSSTNISVCYIFKYSF